MGKRSEAVTWLPGYLVTWLPGYLVTWLPGYLVTWLPEYVSVAVYHNSKQWYREEK